MADRRVFVSIDIPKKLKETAQKHIEPFYKNPLVRVSENKNWHITVVFCGYLDEKGLNKLKETARKIGEETKAFELTPDKIIWAPPNKKPRMLWLTFGPSKEYDNLAKKLIGFADKNMLKPLPHTTFARFKEFHYPNLKPLLPQEGVDLKNEIRPFLANSIEIMESHLNQNGAKYELLEKINLLK